MIWRAVLWCGMVYGMAWYDIVWYGMVLYGLHGMVLYDIGYDTYAIYEKNKHLKARI